MRILKPALLEHANTQSPDVIVSLRVDYITNRMSQCTGLAVHNQVRKLTTGESEKFATVLGQNDSAAHGRVGVLQIVFF